MRIATAQLNYKIGDFAGNYAKIENVLIQKAPTCDLIIFSELALSGYYPMDLIDSAEFIARQDETLAKLETLTEKLQTSIVIGYIDKNKGKGKPYHNSLCLIDKGKRVYSYDKRLLPVYNIFDEARHFAPGKKPGITTFENVKIGFLICEDGWAGEDNFLYECDPVNDLQALAVDLIICINGSPSNLGKQAQRIKHFSTIAKRCHAPLLFINQVGGNDDIIFDGSSFVVDIKGQLQGCMPAFEESVGTLNFSNKQLVMHEAFKPYQPPSECELFYQQTILGLKDYVAKCGFQKVVIGLSGGIDSAITLVLAVSALGKQNVTALSMPARYSSKSSVTDAKALCDILGVNMIMAPIEEEFSLCLTQFEKNFKQKPTTLTEQNIQARLRGRILMEYSNQTGALVISTGNKSELSVGYTTIYGDMTGGFNMIGDLYKTQVYELAKYYNQINPTQAIPLSIIQKAPSAELAPNQKDVDSLPEYEILDSILKLYIEGDLLPKEEKKHYQDKIQHLPPELVSKVHKMVDNAEFKRRQSPPIIRVQRRAFGMGRQVPIAAKYP